MNMIHGKKTGFTLIEVLIVMVIIAVLASLIIPRFSGQRERAIVAEATAMLGAIRQAELAIRTETGAFLATSNPATAADWTAIGVAPGANSNFTYVVSGTIATASRGAGNNPPACTPSPCTITLDLITGQWTGSHPNRPT